MRSKENSGLIEEFSKIYDSLKVESDRGCVLVVASLVENALEEQICARLIPKAEKNDELVSRSTNSPISTFSAKVNLAYRVGIVPEYERNIYHQLRALRNECAHNIDQQDFAKSHFKDRTKNIIQQSEFLWDILKAKLAPILSPNVKTESVNDFVEVIGWRVAFQMFFSLIVAHKKVSIIRVRTISPLYAPSKGHGASETSIAYPT